MTTRHHDLELETLEMKLLLEGIYCRYGYDFRDYAPASLRRRILRHMSDQGIATISALQARVLHHRASMDQMLLAIGVHVTSMFRDPSFFLAFRRHIVPFLLTYPFVRIWHAGCASGEEVMSLAIVLKEEGLYDRCRIYATDLSEAILTRASRRMVPLSRMQAYTNDYQRSGGTKPFSEYFTAKYDCALFNASLLDNVVLSPHNLATDGSFNEFHVILCRNVMIYFNERLQDRVHRLLHASLSRLGVLCMGRNESLRSSALEGHYETIDREEKMYRKIN